MQELPEDENGDLLRRLIDGGDDLSRPRDIDFTVVFPDEVCASAFAEKILGESNELRVNVERTNVVPGLPWDVKVSKFMMPDHREITELENYLCKVSVKFGGRNDGWGCFGQSSPLS